jgi:hypothetical protein
VPAKRSSLDTAIQATPIDLEDPDLSIITAEFVAMSNFLQLIRHFLQTPRIGLIADCPSTRPILQPDGCSMYYAEWSESDLIWTLSLSPCMKTTPKAYIVTRGLMFFDLLNSRSLLSNMSKREQFLPSF